MKRKEFFLAAGMMTALLFAACSAETVQETPTQNAPTTQATSPVQPTQQNGQTQAVTQESKPPILTVTPIPIDENGKEIDVPSSEIPTQEFIIDAQGKLHQK